MADEVRAQIPTGPNGERMAIQIGTKSVAITSRDIVSVLLVLVMGIGFYLTVNSLTQNQERGFQRQDLGFQKLEKILDVLHTNQTAMLAALQQNRDVTGSRLDKQNDLLHEQTEAFDHKIVRLTEYIEAWFSEMGRRQELMNHNALHPDKALPLRAPPPAEDHPPARGR